METNDELGWKIAALMPTCLNDIVRRHREQLAIRLATDKEILTLHHQIVPDRAPRMLIDDWRMVAFDNSVGDFHRVDISLLGNKPNHGVRITSPVRKIDLDRQLVITNSGTLYGLGKPGEEEPPLDHLVTICAAAHSWGWGAAFGVPHFIY